MKNLFTFFLDLSFIFLFATDRSIEQYEQLDLNQKEVFGLMPSGKYSSSFLKGHFEEYLLDSVVK